jgi:hypothetical protein
MADSSIQPTAGSLSAILQHACHTAGCAGFETVDCPTHAYSEDLGVIATFTSEAPNEFTRP